jgi:hypothetical protein
VDGAAETVEVVVGEVAEDVDDAVDGVLGGGLSASGLG